MKAQSYYYYKLNGDGSEYRTVRLQLNNKIKRGEKDAGS